MHLQINRSTYSQSLQFNRGLAAETEYLGLTYFKRFRMELNFDQSGLQVSSIPPGFEMIPFSSELIGEHASAKHESFKNEMDVNLFPCLGRRDGCLRLMREITSRSNFVPEATWLCRYRDPVSKMPLAVGTIQGLEIDGWGAIQNIGISPTYRGHGLGSLLIQHAARGFKSIGLRRMHLEVTTDNTAAIRLYERIGFKRAEVIYKATDVAGA
ncbi:MAG: GNAT family N-acetyltransferase [Rubripirellula sp.]|nr:GNAT family N-acetyltransferase [Rubripirellula sp.]